MSLNVVAVSGSLHAPSKTGALLDAINAALTQRIDSNVTRIDVHELDDVTKAVKLIEGADLLVVASPVYRASYTGAFKQLFDRVGQNALVGTPVLLAATGGSDEHSLVIEHQLRPLFGFFHALSLPYGVYAKDADFTDGVATSPTLLATIDTAIEVGLPFIRADHQLVSAVAGLASGARIIDVRSDAGRDATGTVDGAEVVLKPDVEAWAADQDKDAPLVVFCGSVRGSGPVAVQLAAAGFTNVVHVDGGFAALQAAGASTTAPQS